MATTVQQTIVSMLMEMTKILTAVDHFSVYYFGERETIKQKTINDFEVNSSFFSFLYYSKLILDETTKNVI